jgi:hypothetical protein
MTDITITVNPPQSTSVIIGEGIPLHGISHSPAGNDSLATWYATVGDLNTVSGLIQIPSGIVFATGNQDISGVKNFYSRPTVNGTGVLLVGEGGAASTGALTGAFYPLNANPSGYLTGVDLSNYVTKSSTGVFVTTGQTGNFITTSQTGQFVSTGSTGNFVTGSVVRPSETGVFVTTSQTGQFVSTGSTGNFVTGSVVRPSETGNFIVTTQTGQFVGTGFTGAFLTTGAADGRYALQSATGNFVTTGQTGSFIVSSQTGAFLTTGAADNRYTLQSATGSFVTSSQTGQFVSTGSTGQFVTGSVVRPSQTGAFLTTGAADGRYALQSATGSFVTNSQTGQFVSTGSTGNFVTGNVIRPTETGSFLTTGAADNRYYSISNGQSISGYAVTGFNNSVTGITVTGVNTKTITLFRRDDTALIANFTDESGGVSDTGYLTGYLSKIETGQFVTTGQTGDFLTSGTPLEIIQVYGKNDESFTLYKGQAVYIGGANGANPLIKRASNTGELTSSKTIGLLAQNLSANSFGYIVSEGILEGINTSAATAGDPMWLGETGNLLFGTGNKPYGNNHLVYLGVVLRSQSSNGKVYIKPQNGFEIEELHRVYAKNANTNDTLMYNSGSGSWFARQITTGDVSGISSYVLQSDTGNFATNSSFVSLTGNQNISGVKNFFSRPTVAGTGVLLVGESASSQPNDANTIIALSLFI